MHFNAKLSLLATVATAAFANAQCNGQTAYCDRSWSNITTVGAHDSPFVGSSLSDNQDISITAQLDMGIRFLQGQTHYFLDTLTMCHTSCFLEDAGSLTNFLSEIKTWLDSHPQEVVTVLVTNGDSVGIGNFSEAFRASGIDQYAYVPPTSPNVLPIGEWPTLQQLINQGKRVVAFLGR